MKLYYIYRIEVNYEIKIILFFMYRTFYTCVHTHVLDTSEKSLHHISFMYFFSLGKHFLMNNAQLFYSIL